jgi:hypothetical protein
MDEFINENEDISLPLEPSPHLRHANATDIIEWERSGRQGTRHLSNSVAFIGNEDSRTFE